MQYAMNLKQYQHRRPRPLLSKANNFKANYSTTTRNSQIMTQHNIAHQ